MKVNYIKELRLLYIIIYFIQKHKSLRKSNMNGYYFDDFTQIVRFKFFALDAFLSDSSFHPFYP